MPDLDHRFMVPPFLRISDRRKTPGGGEMILWDLRVSQPNIAHVPPRVLHSVEHFLLDYLKARSDAVICAAPMGCGTGFYIAAYGVADFDTMAALVEDTLTAITTATAVPHANEIRCGRADHHSLAGAQRVAALLLNRRNDWADAGPDAHPV
jgi:S-ribosylhomocysteine lyase